MTNTMHAVCTAAKTWCLHAYYNFFHYFKIASLFPPPALVLVQLCTDPAGKGITNMQMQAIPPDFGKMPRGGGFSNSRLRAVTSPPSKTKRKLSSSADWTISNLTAALGLKAAHTIMPSIDRQGFLHFDPDAPSAGKPTIIHTTSRTTCLAPGQANILKKWLSVPIAAGPVEVWVWTDTGIKGEQQQRYPSGGPTAHALKRLDSGCMRL